MLRPPPILARTALPARKRPGLDGRYKVNGDVGGRFWHVVGLCRFEPGDLQEYTHCFTEHPPHRLGEDDPLW